MSGNHSFVGVCGGLSCSEEEVPAVWIFPEPARVLSVVVLAAVVLGGDWACSLFKILAFVLLELQDWSFLLRFKRYSAQDSSPPRHTRSG
jgi:hypothetical protein